MTTATSRRAAATAGARRTGIPRIALFAAVLLCAIPFSASAEAPVIPEETALFVRLNFDRKDPGQRWIYDSLWRYLLSEAGDDEKIDRIGNVDLFQFSRMSLAVLPGRKGGERMLLAAELAPSDGSFGIEYGGAKLQLNVRDRNGAAETQRGLLSMLLSIACRIPASAKKPADGIYFNPDYEDEERFSAYHVGDRVALLASDRALVKSALSGKDSLASSAEFKKTMDLLPKGWDAYGFAHRDRAMTGRLEELKEWKGLIVSLLGEAARLGFALDVKNRQESTLSLALVPGKADDAAKLRARLEPLVGTLIRAYLDSNIEIRTVFNEKNGAVIATAELAKTGRFWDDLFDGGNGGSGTDKPVSERAEKDRP